MGSEARTWAICHYEDEPQRVELPHLIEIGLFQLACFSETDIESEDDTRTHKISFVHEGIPHVVHYFIRLTPEEMRACLRKVGPDCSVILSMMDLSMSGSLETGAAIVRERCAEGSGGEIWMVTGYPVETRRILQESNLDVRVIAKPYNHLKVRDEILDILVSAVFRANGGERP